MRMNSADNESLARPKGFAPLPSPSLVPSRTEHRSRASNAIRRLLSRPASCITSQYTVIARSLEQRRRMLPSDIPTPALYTFRSSFLANDSPIISAFVAMVKARGLPPPRQGGESFVNFASRIDSIQLERRKSESERSCPVFDSASFQLRTWKS